MRSKQPSPQPIPTATPSLTLTLVGNQVLDVALKLNTIADQHLLATIAFEQARGAKAAEIENRTYHMGNEPTAGCGYDDRLTTRLKCSATKAYEYLKATRGGLQSYRIGKEYRITEWAVRQFEGRPA